MVGVDVGGTFTYLVLVDEATGEVRVAKAPTTDANQATGVQAALAGAGGGGRAEGDRTRDDHRDNALLEAQGRADGAITTRGSRDAPELGLCTRPTPYGLEGSSSR